MKKRVLITLLDDNEGLARLLCQDVAKVALEPVAHLWTDDLVSMAWASVGPELCRVECRLWIIAGTTARFADSATRQGLALAALMAQAVHGKDFPILLSPSAGTVDVNTLPTPLRGAESIKTGLGAKAAIRAAAPRGFAGDYRLNVHALHRVGLWLEVGPTRDPWDGALLGCSGTDAEGKPVTPTAHGVGQAGTIPATSTLHYPVQGIHLDAGDVRCEAWGLKNALPPSESYYVRLSGTPEKLVFGAFPDSGDAELFTLNMV